MTGDIFFTNRIMWLFTTCYRNVLDFSRNGIKISDVSTFIETFHCHAWYYSFFSANKIRYNVRQARSEFAAFTVCRRYYGLCDLQLDYSLHNNRELSCVSLDYLVRPFFRPNTHFDWNCMLIFYGSKIFGSRWTFLPLPNTIFDKQKFWLNKKLV